MTEELKNSCGYTKEQLLDIKGEEPVHGFAEFWSEQYERTASCKLNYTVEEEVWSPFPDIKIYRVSFISCDGFKIGMWVSRPEKSCGGHIVMHGYSNDVRPHVSQELRLTTAVPCVPGLGISMCKDVPWQLHHHAAYGFEDPEKYVLVSGVRNIWTSISILIDMFPDVKDSISCSGGSLGGGMGALAVPWDFRIKAAELNVPTLGGRIMLEHIRKPTDPSYVRAMKAKESESNMRTFDLCNAASSARYIKVPVLVTPALCDNMVPPPGQFAVANSIPEEFRILRIREVGHSSPSQKDIEMETELNQIRKNIFLGS